MPAAAAGLRLDVFLARRFSCSRTAVQSRMAGPVRDAQERTLKWSHKLRAGEVVCIPCLRRPEPQVAVRYQILFEDDRLVVVDKGPGAPVHPVRSFRTRSVLTRLQRQLGLERLAPAHRLDRETSGVLVFAKDPAALTAIMGQFAAGTVRKEYLALVSQPVDFERRLVDAPLGPDPDFAVRSRQRVDAEAGRPAQTEFEVILRGRGLCLLRARPHTGRTHQIRLHLAHLGLPVVGDKLYRHGGQAYLDLIAGRFGPDWIARLGHDRHALHAARLTLRHPGSEREQTFVAPWPADLHGLLPFVESESSG